MALRIANLGAEEGARAAEPAALGRAATLARLWADLLEPPAPFSWLEGEAFAWLNTPEARDEAAAQGLTLFGASPEIVARVHDKAFAADVARRERLGPAWWHDAVRVLAPEELEDPDRVRRIVRDAQDAMPTWCRGAITLKPRRGTSGRGRLAGDVQGFDAARLSGALPRLRAQGGAVLEPWLERIADFSVQLHVGPGGLVLVGALEQVLRPSGIVLGHRGFLDHRGRVTTGSPFEEELREAAACVANAAAEVGYRGPCGVDAFAFRGEDGDTELRPAVELNARFTAGLVAAGWTRRLLPRIRAETGLDPGESRAFLLGLEPPPGGWPAPSRECFIAALAGEAALVVGREAAAVDALLREPAG